MAPVAALCMLKAMQVTPTGAPCVPLSLDPDYCSGDKFYAFGVAVVSTVIGALLAQGRLLTFALDPLYSAVRAMLDSTCSVSNTIG